MDYAFGTNPFLLENQDGITVLKGRYTEVKQTAGAYQGYEKITEKSIGESYKIYSFLVRYERFPLRFIFILYRANDTWRVNNFNYDDELIEELIASAKQDRL